MVDARTRYFFSTGTVFTMALSIFHTREIFVHQDPSHIRLHSLFQKITSHLAHWFCFDKKNESIPTSTSLFPPSDFFAPRFDLRITAGVSSAFTIGYLTISAQGKNHIFCF